MVRKIFLSITIVVFTCLLQALMWGDVLPFKWSIWDYKVI